MNDTLSAFTLSPEEYDALTREDFWLFVHRVHAELFGQVFDDNWHIEVLCSELDRVRTTPNTRLAIALPPRSLKSVVASVALPAWLLGHNPGMEIVCVSYGQELADHLSAECRRVMVSPWYRRVFPAARLNRQAAGHLVTVQGGKRYATSVGGVLTGMGADVIIVDDPMKANEALSDLERTKINDWACHTLFTRLNRKSDDRIVVVQQRLHEDDMIGRVQSIAGFKLLSFSAIAQEDEVHRIETPFGNRSVTRTAGEALHPAREPVEVLHKQRELMGTAFFAAQYLQSPTPPGGGLVKAEWFQRYTPGQTPPFAEIIQSWDCASKATQLSDYSVCTTWGVTHDKQIWLLDVFRNRLEYPQLKKKVRELADLRRAGKVVIEDTAAGIQLIQELKQEGFYRLHAIKPRGDKTMRMAAQTPAIEGSRVFIPREAFWLADFLHEVTMFPKGRHDDQVDSMSQALAFIGAPVAFQGLFDYYRLEAMKIFGLKPEDLTHIFDVAGEGVGFTGGRGGREIKRGEDGLYRVTADEWETVGRWPGVQLLWPIEK